MSLGELQFAQVVVKFHHLRGLEECRLSCSRLVLDNTFNLTPVGVEHRYHETPVTNSHLGILRRPTFALGTAQRAAYLRVHFIAFARHLSPDVLQRRRCIVEYLSFVVYYFSKPAQNIGIKLDALCKGKKRWILDTAVGQQETQTGCKRLQRGLEVGQGLEFNDRPCHLETCQFLTEVDKVLRRKGILHQQNLAKLLSLPELALYSLVVLAKSHLAHHPFCQRIGSLGSYKLAYLVK